MDGQKFLIIYLCIESIKFLAAKVLSQKEHLEILRDISKNQRQAADTMAHIAAFRCPYIDECKSEEEGGRNEKHV